MRGNEFEKLGGGYVELLIQARRRISASSIIILTLLVWTSGLCAPDLRDRANS